MLSTIKAALRRTPIYPHYFARRTAPGVLRWTDEDEDRLRFYRQFVKAGDLVIDVGANVGHMTKVFLRLECKVIAVEPQTICAATLRRAFGNKITVLKCGLSDHNGNAPIYSVDGMSVVASLEQDWIHRVQKSGRFSSIQWKADRQINLSTLDEVIAAHGIPAFIKIDTEGHERSVLKGLSTPVRALNFEFVPENGEAGIACIDIVASIGRYEFNFSRMDANHLEAGWCGAADIKTFLANHMRQSKNIGDVYARLVARD